MEVSWCEIASFVRGQKYLGWCEISRKSEVKLVVWDKESRFKFISDL